MSHRARIGSPARRRWVVGGSAVVLGVSTRAQGTHGDRPGLLDSTLRPRIGRDMVGLAAAQVGPEGVRLTTLGVQRQGEATPVTRETLFELGSITKAFVALVLADDVLNGRVRLDDAAEEGLPGGLRLRDNKGEPIRMVDLATHRSGLPRMPTNLSRRELNNPYPHYTDERLLDFVRTWQAEAARGSRFEYSNLGYGLLAHVLARRAGTTVDAMFDRRIFQPLGLRDLRIRRPLPAGDDLAAIGAALGASIKIAPREATGHDAQLKPVAAWEFGALAGAIGLVGPVTAVARFMEAAVGLFDHPLQPAFAMCLGHRSEGEHPLHPFGLAWEISPLWLPQGRRTLFNQDGATGGFSTSLWIEPARRRGAAILCNTFVETRSLALQALDASLDEAHFALDPLPVDQLAPLVGTYQLDAKFSLAISSRDGRLWARGTGLDEFELLPATPRHFFSRNGVLQIRFDENPQPRYLMANRESGSLLFRRLP